ncbi:MAG: hypothetical protein HQK75_07235 [Candidatus Magnetomorum sp.]|nr:hypothetical protein [Candidatus Magnetomorum sp.]
MIEYETIKRPTLLRSLYELKIIIDIAKSIAFYSSSNFSGSKMQRKILLLPGFGMGEKSMKTFQKRLNQCGHKAMMWGLGRNHGQVTPLLKAFHERLDQVYQEEGCPIDLIGWSLGGYIAREVAREKPDAVRQIITLASPVVGGPKYTLCGRFYEKSGWDLNRIEATTQKKFDSPLQVPVVSLYTRTDGVVSWEACIDRWSPHVRHIEVRSSHMGIPFSLDVFARVVENL